MTIDTLSSSSPPNSNKLSTAQRRLKVAIIGAGVSGLATSAALVSEGHFVTVYEKSNRLGGTWVYDPRVESDPLGIDPEREIVHGSI
ncbi:hypothetical protein CASFOL_041240 [Castilleja foliolosa]|uniref:Flavin-containing monooxygenase n=1 Tax=Castilleja foliolosa TaxID=1961234 RepID=A0ABD3BE78_9LAMI